jgi:STE24 endopeptidase
MASDPPRPGRTNQPDFFGDESDRQDSPEDAVEGAFKDAENADEDAADIANEADEARIVRQFQRHERAEVVDAEIEEAEEGRLDEEPLLETNEAPPEEEPQPQQDEPGDDKPAAAPPVEIGPAPEQTEEQRTEAKRYEAIHNRLFLLDIVATALALVLFLFLGFSTNLKLFVEQRISDNPFAVVAFYGIIVTIVYYFVILIPLHFWDRVYELRFGLSRQSSFDWISDEFKSMGLNMILLVVFLELVYALLRATPAHWWLWAAAAWTVLVVVLTKLAPVLLIPIFYKREPLENDELAERLRHLVERVRMSVVAVEKLGLAAKTVKANAMLAGLGNTKRVLLGDTLLENFTDDEIETVLAHELGHHYHNHIWKLIGAGAVATFAGFLVASVVLHALVVRLGFEGVSDIASFPVLAAALLVMAIVAMPATNAFSRVLERQADRFAVRLTRKPDAFIAAMRRLAVRNLADTEPSPVVEALLHGHPSISRRIAAAEAMRDEEQ